MLKKYENYKITRNGDIQNIKTGRFLSKCIKNGYYYISIRNKETKKIDKIYLHRILASEFIPNPNNLPQVNHIDGNKLNNDISNLEWCTTKHNLKHAYESGLRVMKGKKSKSKYDEKTIKDVFYNINKPKEAKEKYNMPKTTYQRIKGGIGIYGKIIQM